MTCREVVDAFETMKQDGMFTGERFQLYTIDIFIFITFYPTSDKTGLPYIDCAIVGKDGETGEIGCDGCITMDDLPKWDGRTVRTLAQKVKDSEWLLEDDECDHYLIGARHVVSLVVKLLSLSNS